MQELLTHLLGTHAAGRPVAYTALVETRGSTPQKPGAAMLVFPDGSQAGTLGGGCVEAEVKRQALSQLQSGSSPSLLGFQLDKDYGWDDGLICGGRMLMLVDPVTAQSSVEYYQTLAREVARGCTEATIIKDVVPGAPAASRFLFAADGQLLCTAPANLPVPEVVTQHLRPLIGRPRAYFEGAVSYLPHLPRVPLYIVGAGHVGQMVARYAAEVDFDITVIDDREQYCNFDRFPQARQCLVGNMEAILPQLEIPAHAFCLIVTRGHQHDEEALFHLVKRPSAYLGMIGSRRKIRLIYDDLIEQGIPAADLERVHAPLGLKIGSQTVAEIAISIVAELIACRNLGPSPD